jgi:hypothetical protein
MIFKIENPNPYGSRAEEKLHLFEQTLGIALPLQYREFLENYNGGQPKPNGFWITKNQDGSEIHQLYGLHDGPTWYSIDCKDRYGIPEGLLSIGDDGIGNSICIGLFGDKRGTIYFIDHELSSGVAIDSMTGVTKIADSFSQFLATLQVLEQIM